MTTFTKNVSIYLFESYIYRDLKTQNVFMTKTGMTCKLGKVILKL